jgi:hypothetical protein
VEGNPEMNINCNNIDDLLLEGDSRSMELAEQHARRCPECAEKLDGWNDISETAQALQADWPSDMLWPRIQRSLAAEKRTRFISTAWRVAAAVILVVGMGTGSWLAARHSQEVTFERHLMSASALDEVEQAEKAHIAAIDHLAKVADTKIEENNSPLMVSYKEKLMLLDDAIAECQTNIDRNRQNAHLRKQLLAIYTEKQRTLEQVMREGNHVSNQ